MFCIVVNIYYHVVIMTFSDVLKNAAINTFNDPNKKKVFDAVMSVFKNQNACPQGPSPKELLMQLAAAINKALKQKRAADEPFIKEVYDIAISPDVAAPPPAGNVDLFIQNIESELGNASRRLPAHYQARFNKAAQDNDVIAALTDIYDRIVHRYVVVSSSQSGGTYSNLSTDGSVDINLSCRTQQTTGDSVEDAIRNVFFDVRKARKLHGRSDLVVDGKIIEIKYTRDQFTGLATDSQALKVDPKKWYLYVAGDIPRAGQAGAMKAWFISSEDLYNAVSQTRSHPSINPSSPTALAEIESEIDTIKGQLAQAIYNRSITSQDEATPTQMTLDKSVGVNRVRFDIKFEGLLRAYVREMLRS